MKVEIISWTSVAAWRWLVREDDDVCGICRIDFDATCPSCKFPGDDCPLIYGHCKHNFHSHCLTGWLNQESAQGRCPMCRQPFQESLPPDPEKGHPELETFDPNDQPRINPQDPQTTEAQRS